VTQAREAIASQYEKPPEAVFLHFLRKTLRDNFMMDRIRLGTANIYLVFTE
jgi:hypothetical protein